MQCTDAIRMDPPLAVGVVMISTYPMTLETTENPPPDAVARTTPSGYSTGDCHFLTWSPFSPTDIEVFYEAGNQEKHTFSSIDTS